MSEKIEGSTEVSTQAAEKVASESTEAGKPEEGKESSTDEAASAAVEGAAEVVEGPEFGKVEKPAEVEEEDDSKILAELLTDPKQVVADLKRDVKKDLRAEMKQETDNQKSINDAWGKFYADNPDLAKARKITELCEKEYLTELHAGGREVSWAEGTKEVAKRARLILSSMGTETEVVNTEDASKTSEIPSSDSGSMPAGEKESASGGFIQEMKNMKSKQGIA